MALVKDRVLVLKGVSYSEADRILTVYGRNRGKFGIIAKGVRKITSKNRGSVQTLSLSEITYYEGRNLGALVEASLVFIPEYDGLILGYVSKILYLMNKLLPDDDPDDELFSRIEKVIMAEEVTLREINKFRMWVLEHLGYLGDMRHCAKCGNHKGLKYVSLKDMKMLCDPCYGDTYDKLSYLDVGSTKYEGIEMDAALDNYVRGVVEE